MPTALMHHEAKNRLDTSHEPTVRKESSLWDVLYSAGLSQVNKLSLALDEVAPTPGFLVYFEIKRSSYRLNDFEPFLFTAIDVCTHLQIAQYYLTGSVASAVDFLEYVTLNFPFEIREVRTKADSCFTSSSMPQSFHRFTSACVQHEVLHSVITDRQQDEVTELLCNLTFGGIFEGSVDVQSETSVMNELSIFLFFHNNHRSLPSLFGKTPLQKLKMFLQDERLIVFNPMNSSVTPISV